MPEYRIGASRDETITVGNDHAITFLGPSGPRVLSTPRMIGFMEATSRNLALSMLDEGQDTVGTHVNVSHCAAAPLGSSVTFHAEVAGVNKRRVQFNVRAVMNTGTPGGKLIGEGTHERAVIDIGRFKAQVEEGSSTAG
ncbi:MAG: thioesterase family protein [Terriglobia bacterium]